MYVEVVKSKQGGRVYKTTLIRETYREDGKVKHRTLANISKLPDAEIALVRQVISNNGMADLDQIATRSSKEFGGSFAFLELARDIGLDKTIYSRAEPWRQNALAMIVGRILFQGSKLGLVNLFADTALWELCGHGEDSRPGVREDCYEALDQLLARQPSIQRKLAEKHLADGCLVLYDLTNIWLEGEYAESELAAYGRGKGGKHGYKQIAIGLIANREGCPVAVEVFSGNTSDQSTVWGQAQKLAGTYGVQEVVLAGDRGVLTPKRIEEVNRLGFKTLTALTHPQIQDLLEKRNVQPTLFDDTALVELVDPDNETLRHILCKNPETMRRETATRQSLIGTVTEQLGKIARVSKKRDPQTVCARVGALLGKYKIGKFFTWHVDENGRLAFALDEARVAAEEALDGCYVIRSDASARAMNKEEAVAGYMALRHVETAFRNLKTVSLEMRPVYHKTDDRIRAHVFLCFLAYHLQWHAQQRLKPLFDADGTHDQRRWSMPVVIERLKSLRREQLLVNNIPVRHLRTQPDPEQQQILDCLGVKGL